MSANRFHLTVFVICHYYLYTRLLYATPSLFSDLVIFFFIRIHTFLIAPVADTITIIIIIIDYTHNIYKFDVPSLRIFSRVFSCVLYSNSIKCVLLLRLLYTTFILYIYYIILLLLVNDFKRKPYVLSFVIITLNKIE